MRRHRVADSALERFIHAACAQAFEIESDIEPAECLQTTDKCLLLRHRGRKFRARHFETRHVAVMAGAKLAKSEAAHVSLGGLNSAQKIDRHGSAIRNAGRKARRRR